MRVSNSLGILEKKMGKLLQGFDFIRVFINSSKI